MRVAVVGGGIAGLAAAWELVAQGAEVTVLEPAHLGGRIKTVPFRGHPVDTGADAFLCRVPDAIRLATELGMESELVAPAAGGALLWLGGRLRPLPPGLVLGAPARLWPLLSSRILSPAGVARAGLDLILPTSEWPAGTDVSVATVIGRRFGRQVAERLVDPLVGGIHAGRTDELSVTAAAPQLAEAARRHRSLLLGLRRQPAAPPGPVFLAPKGGMGRLVDRLVEALIADGVTFETVAVTAVRQPAAGQVVVDPAGSFDAAVLATPASVTARLVEQGAPDAARLLGAIRDASVVMVTFAYPAESIRVPPGTSGWLVPRAEGHLMTACSFGSAKWPHWSDRDSMVLRVSSGRSGDRRAIDMSDETVVERLQSELARALGTEVAPLSWRVSRWPEAFPQYEVSHLDRVARIEQALQDGLPSVALAGASFRGSGVPACVASGRRAAVLIRRTEAAGR